MNANTPKNLEKTMTANDLAKSLAEGCIERAKSLGWKGQKTKTDNALNYLCGAAQVLHILGHDDA